MSDIHAGDSTGKLAARLRAENAEQLTERERQIGLVSSGVVEELEGVWDPVSGQRLEISEEEMKALRSWPAPSEVEVEEVLDVGPDHVVVRPVQDIEGMTYGIGNTLNLRRARRYRVSREIALHLESKGLVQVVWSPKPWCQRRVYHPDWVSTI